MKKIIIISLFLLTSYISFGQSNTYFHDRIDTTVFAVADTVGHGANNYYATNTSPDFNVKQYVNGLSVILFIKKGNTGSSTLTLVTRTATLSTKTIRKANGAVLLSGDIKDSTTVLFTYYNGSWRFGDLTPASSTSWLLTGNSGTTAGTNFIGTIDSIDFVFKVNNIERGRINRNGGSWTLGSTGATQGKLNLKGITSGSVTITPASAAGVWTFTLPIDDGTSSQFLQTDGNGITSWQTITPATIGAWSITGNSGTIAGTNFLGTTDDIDLVFKRNSIQSGLLNESLHNTSFGVSALLPATTGTEITAIGYGALQSNTSGINNTAVGYVALGSNTTALGSTAVGYSALATSTGGENTAYGWKSLRLNTTGTTNTGLGVKTLENNTIGINNTAVGTDVLLANVDGNWNVGVGMNSLLSNVTGDFNTAIGYEALNFNLADENIAMGRRALYNNTTGTGNTALGTVSLFTNTTTSFNTAVGYASLLSNIAANNTAVGYSSMTTNSTGTENVAIGKESMNNNSIGSDNSAFGYRSLFSSTGDNNTAIGTESGRQCTGSSNLFVGRYAGFWQTAVSNLGIIDDRLRADAATELIKAPIVISFGVDSSAQSVKFNSQVKLTSGINTTAGDAATIDAQSGRFRKDASGSTFTLTNLYITANSIILLTNVTTGITTGYQLSVQAGAGSATITFETAGVAAAPSANMDINFIVINNN